jgi:D-beta-D-heptose 7-phosphate kinase/D-beta-D-heptose 1-phosphate adenosyltransferase
MNTLLKESILRTLKYHDVFDYPLTQSEIYGFLIYDSRFMIQDLRLNFKIQTLLNELVKDKKIVQKDHFYCLKGREKTIDLRKQRKKYSQQKIVVANKVVQLIKLIPWVKMIGITGALAMNNSTENDDIDLLIITTKNRLWLTRLILVLVLELLGYRRKPQTKNYKNKICLNMFLDETALRQAQERQNLYTAHEIVQMKPIFNKQQTYKRFLSANEWVQKYLPNSIEVQKLNLKSQNYNSKFKIIIKLFDSVEQFVYWLQVKYMKSKMTREQVSEHFAFFHPQDRTKEILGRFNLTS